MITQGVFFICYYVYFIWLFLLFNNLSRRIFILSSIISILLYAVEHSYKPLGIFTAALWGIPFTITYIKTKNIYIPMTAHLICNFVGNGIPALIMAAKMLKIL
ncbi:CPBP family intramembrane metalloprotease [Caldicellulosiruptor changbaiensis]|uniref:CPBP family intramembrane metalloprotease n=1 Tax=Caldicellulosiruptor changbaiensis TaxID=1222016 RepID=A0A3T0D941_9FIRM|nr:CPBP family glutamic-type intramembrane protease [Caldicellulosiruptor changbaiensis]AZT91701.1 CPBP family intramembrane metalloprotease [Caldicellulosiruptor changbaiensis]